MLARQLGRVIISRTAKVDFFVGIKPVVKTDRNAQFEYINRTAKEYLSEGEPVLSIDCKMKENLENFKNNGHEYCHKKSPRKVLDHDFLIKELGSVAPYGIYDADKNTGFVNLGLSHDTAEFAVNSIMQW